MQTTCQNYIICKKNTIKAKPPCTPNDTTN